MRVLVADDHSLFRDGIITLLKASGFDVVGQAGNGEVAVEETLRIRPDLVLMDINMPVVNGLEALKRIKQTLPETQVVMLTVSEENVNLLEAIKCGARGYLLKDLTASEFVEMLAGLENGEAAFTRRTVSRLLDNFAKINHPTPESNETLTPREIELLQWVARGLSNKAIAQELSVGEHTVKYHMKKILRKLDAQNRTEAVSYAIQLGIIQPPRVK